jgi:hypothetical protein
MRDLPKWRNEEGKTAERREILRRGGERGERGGRRKEKRETRAREVMRGGGEEKEEREEVGVY